MHWGGRKFKLFSAGSGFTGQIFYGVDATDELRKGVLMLPKEMLQLKIAVLHLRFLKKFFFYCLLFSGQRYVFVKLRFYFRHRKKVKVLKV